MSIGFLAVFDSLLNAEPPPDPVSGAATLPVKSLEVVDAYLEANLVDRTKRMNPSRHLGNRLKIMKNL